jgi:DNA-binding transcriptional LysR family regulator
MMDNTSFSKLARSTTLRYFSEVAERGSFRGAAESLHIAASAINRQITNLEADLGVKLFERARGPTGLRLTDAGHILRIRLRSAMNELRIASEEITALQGLQRGHVIVGANDGVASRLLPKTIQNFRQLYPNITFGIKVDHTRSLVAMLKEGEIDLAVGYSFPANYGLLFKASVSLRMYIITSLEHDLATQPYIALADLSGTDLILPDSTLLLRQILDSALLNSDVRIDPVVETNSFELMRSLVVSGVGVSFVSGQEAQIEDQGPISFVEIKDSILPTGLLACCTLADRNLSVAAEAFIESISSALKHSF